MAVSKHDKQQQWRVPDELAKSNLDKVVAQLARVSRRIARTYIATGRVTVNGKGVRILTRPVAAGATVALLSPEAHSAVESATKPRAPARHAEPGVLFLDKYLVGLFKPAGLLSEHDRFGSPSLESIVPKMLSARGEKQLQTWLVHRLDAGTSGVMVMTRTPMATAYISELFKNHTIQKEYWALVQGIVREAQDVDAPLGRDQGTRQRVDAAGKPAFTRVEPMSHFGNTTLVRCLPRTGRTHQIRVHMAHIGHPLLGDRLYGGPVYTPTNSVGDLPKVIERPMLHAYQLTLLHPKTHEKMVLKAEPPVDFLGLMV